MASHTLNDNRMQQKQIGNFQAVALFPCRISARALGAKHLNEITQSLLLIVFAPDQFHAANNLQVAHRHNFYVARLAPFSLRGKKGASQTGSDKAQVG